ncbi:hypothetical protein D8674_012801 [Pyrus ussuriensis x Pyrus communis]|uniref:Uncharacterized protein n=1 Tax=Pyrus ussuriensis x Pyrus communis TaxID=2448454 RepID=A0A5N5GTD8_9ROSA|nr:hypothetical protein D8674_012801 [Pyrus ussuriensis x Pyrus communis]
MDGRKVNWSTAALQRDLVALALDILNEKENSYESRVIPPKRPLERRVLRQAQPTSPLQAPRPAPKLERVRRLDRPGRRLEGLRLETPGQPAQLESRQEQASQ